VNADELDRVLEQHPLLFHMAQRGSWASIAKRGLLSTTALLDLFEYEGAKRQAIEAVHRPESVRIKHADLGTAVIRDQKPMSDAGLVRALRDGLTPEEWYRILNSRVFFWLTKDRLNRLLTAKAYINDVHDVLVVDARPLVASYRRAITLSPINSGATKPMPHPRGRDTFLPIDDYPYRAWTAKRRNRDPIVELAVAGGVPDIAEYVVEVLEMRGGETLKHIWQR
jgi:hypothetical protein